MIDTDKYEGHRPGPWKIYYDKWNKTGWYIDSIARYDVGEGDEICQLYGTAQNKDPTAKLIADAPLLLEAYKRLREQLTSADKMIREMIRESRDTPREAYVSGSAREAEQLFVHVLEANWDEVIE